MVLKRRDMKPIIRDMLLTMPHINEMAWKKLRNRRDVQHIPIWKNLFKYVEREELAQLRRDAMNIPLRTRKVRRKVSRPVDVQESITYKDIFPK